MRRWSWAVGIAGVLLLALAWWVYESGFMYTYKYEIAHVQCIYFAKQCNAYRQRSGDGKFPARLSEIVAPSDGSKPLVDGGENTLLDPWLKPYRYAVVETEAGHTAYVWAEWESRGKTRVTGAKVAADGIVRPFATPE